MQNLLTDFIANFALWRRTYEL